MTDALYHMTNVFFQGYTQEIFAESDEGDQLYLLVQPGTDYNETFEAYDTKNQEFVRVNGWLFSISAD